MYVLVMPGSQPAGVNTSVLEGQTVGGRPLGGLPVNAGNDT